MEIILAGQPNCGKSTIFNEVAGYKSISNNISGSTVEYTKSSVNIDNHKVTVVDLPGLYSMQPHDEAEYTAIKYIADSSEESLIINIIDASVLSRSLELTLQLLELGKPMIIALNMMDEAERKGIIINKDLLSKKLGVPVIETIAKKGYGVSGLFKASLELLTNKIKPENKIKYSTKIEKTISDLKKIVNNYKHKNDFKSRFTAIQLLLHNDFICKKIKEHYSPDHIQKIKNAKTSSTKQEKLELSTELHDKAFSLFESCATVGKPIKKDFREKIDAVLMHPVFGYFFMVIILYSIFALIFNIGSLIEPLFVKNFESISIWLAKSFSINSLTYAILNGLFQGFGGGIGIVVPFLLPFFIALAMLEDTGYLSRIAFLIDTIMHKIGLHGMSVVPMIMGYGCTVPGILATRILPSKRDKFITATLATLVPCSARMTIIFGLVGFFISIKAAITIYIINIIIIGIVGKFMSKAYPEVSPGLMEIPRYHMPTIKTVLRKTWFRMKEFVVIAWPILIIGSIVLETINYTKLGTPINNFLSPFTSGVLGLPAAVGITLIFGIMRKELSLILLFTALGTKDINSVLTTTQIFSFTFFVTFYIPCLATFAALARELQYKKAIFISLLTTIIAIALAVIIRIIFPLFI